MIESRIRFPFGRVALCVLAISLVITPGLAADDSKDAWAALVKGGHVALIRHGNAPPGYGGDPPGFKIDDCKTQRNLDEPGREEARALGEAFRKHGVRVDRILSSPWCRCLETARLMAVGPVETSWALVPDQGPSVPVRLQELKEMVSAWRGPGTLVLVTHAFTVRALLGFLPTQGETVVLKPGSGAWGGPPFGPPRGTEIGTDNLAVTKETDVKLIKLLTWVVWSVAFTLTALPGLAADYPAPKEGSWVVRDFRFHTGEVLPELRLHYTTVGAPTGEPVLILHGTTGSGAGMLTPAFAGELFGPGQPLDASRYYIILPDAIGTGKSTKPSDGLRASFPQYNYDDMVDAQYRLVTEHLGVRHLRLVLGIRWAACRPGSGPRNIRTSWMSRCRWRRCRPRCPAATG